MGQHLETLLLPNVVCVSFFEITTDSAHWIDRGTHLFVLQNTSAPTICSSTLVNLVSLFFVSSMIWVVKVVLCQIYSFVIN
uniref:Uncharacterized protein n=1 Tax=Arundo donax TaxID=35708 RepID=A0A0A8Z8M8_ARUDO